MRNSEKLIEAVKHWSAEIDDLSYGSIEITIRGNKLARMEISRSIVFDDRSEVLLNKRIEDQKETVR